MLRFSVLLIVVNLTANVFAGNGGESDAITEEFNSVINTDGTYAYKYATSNGISAQESGIGGAYASGSASHYAPDGTFIQLTYTADENGFQPQGDHLPTPPPIPDYILRAIQYIQENPAPQEQPYETEQSAYSARQFRPFYRP